MKRVAVTLPILACAGFGRLCLWMTSGLSAAVKLARRAVLAMDEWAGR